MIVRVTTYLMSDGKETATRLVNYQRHAEHKWLVNHMRWCFRNGHGVQIHEVNDEPPPIARQHALSVTRSWLLDRAIAADHEAVIADVEGSPVFARLRRSDAETLRSMAR